ncbi:MAG: UvrD-helicase domain-containing protein [Pseudomonadota bacterium]
MIANDRRGLEGTGEGQEGDESAASERERACGDVEPYVEPRVEPYVEPRVGPRRVERPAIIASIPRDNHAVIEASAGTGKTYTLEHLVVELLLNAGVTIDQILVVTFTQRATAELKQRVRATIERLLQDGCGSPSLTGDGDGASDGGAGNEPASAPSSFWLIDGRARARLAAALHSFDSATICTIHSFCQRLLTEHAFWGRRLFEQTLVDGREAFRLAFREALRTTIAVDDGPRQYLEAALEAGHTVEELEAVLYQCVHSRAKVAPVFDSPRLLAALDAYPGDGCAAALEAALSKAKVHSATRRSIATRVAKVDCEAEKFRHDRNLPALLAALEEYDRDRGSKAKRIAELPAELLGLVPGSGVAASLGALLVAVVEALVSLPAAAAQLFLPSILGRLRQRKQELGLFDFDDSLLLVREMLDGSNSDRVIGALRQQFHYALIDEFQDTDEVQWSIFRRVFCETGRNNAVAPGSDADGSPPPGPCRLYVIGDPKQAIYGFRGADVQTYLRAREAIRGGGGSVVQLAHCYRATPQLVEACNTLFSQDAPRPLFRSGGQIRYDNPVGCGNPTLAATSDRGRDGEPVHLFELVAADGGRARVGVLLRSLANRIAATSRHLLDSSSQEPLLRGIGARDIFVLTRTEREGRIVGRALRSAGVPCAFYRQDGLFQTVEAADLRDLLGALASPDDRAARFRAWLTPFFGLTLEDLAGCRDLPDTHRLVSLLDEWRSLADDRAYSVLFQRIVEGSGIARRELFLDETGRALTNYLHILELLQEEASRRRCSIEELHSSLTGFIAGTRAPIGGEGNTQRLESDRAAVQIMTIHKAKGLEATVVFLFGGLGRSSSRPASAVFHDRAGERTIWLGPVPPEIRQRQREEEDDEERRLMYVALTRARARLYLPFLPTDDDGLVEGCYAPVNDRLRDLRPMMAEPPLCRLFVGETVECGASHDDGEAASGQGVEPLPLPLPLPLPRPRSGPGPDPIDLSRWAPPSHLLAQADCAEDATALARRHRGFAIVSYSGMKTRSPAEVDEDQPGLDQSAESLARSLATAEAAATAKAQTTARPRAELPGGTASGVFLHEVLAKVPLDTLSGGLGLHDWSAIGQIDDLFDQEGRRHGIDPAHLEHAKQLVFAALATPVVLPTGEQIPGLGLVEKCVREMDFFYPIPEAKIAGTPKTAIVTTSAARLRRAERVAALHHFGGRPGDDAPRFPSSERRGGGVVLRRTSAGSAGTLQPGSTRGLVKGYVDLVFEHRSRFYFVDWKSDFSTDSTRRALEEHVEREYSLQIRLYSLAMTRLLRITSAAEHDQCFGGFLYCFLRTMATGSIGDGTIAGRPSWDEIRAWEADLALSPY